MSEPASNRFRSEDCEQQKHEECAKSSMIGICGCECHDYLDDLDEMLYEKPAREGGK